MFYDLEYKYRTKKLIHQKKLKIRGIIYLNVLLPEKTTVYIL